MIKPQKPKNETQRLQALRNLNILDTQSEERFDCITRVAQNLFHVPIASVSFVDKEREWFKSKYGLQFEETPREISFGAHVILTEEIMIVKDTLNDIRFKDNPLVLGNPEIRFYLGCPLKIKGEFNIGTLCLIDYKAQQFSDADLDIVKDLAATVEAEFNAHLSTIDELTKLSNRQGLLPLGKQIIKRCNQQDRNLLLLYFDIKNLKFINDHYGHDEGDKVIKIFAQQLFKNFRRRSDAVARLGGDKFCVLCPGMFKEHLPNVMKRLQNKLASVQTNYPIEFSMGALAYDRSHHSINSLVEEAYEKVYEDKRHYH